MIDTGRLLEVALECPLCSSPVRIGGRAGECQQSGHVFPCVDGIWRFLPSARADELVEFLSAYRRVRESEGWGSARPEYYRALPCVPADDPQYPIWHLRELAFRRLLALFECGGPERVLDAGAGNGWLAYRLSSRGHRIAALDISDDPYDGLGARVNYGMTFDCYQAEFDRMPFCSGQFDTLVFNASLHYATRLELTLKEAARVTRRGGRIVVLDSPFYKDPASGRAMVAEREAGFKSRFGLEREVRSISFLTIADVDKAARSLGLGIEIVSLDATRSTRLRRAWNEWRSGREQARFPLIVLTN